jgi:DNA-binding CsgD family transcriptional regulator
MADFSYELHLTAREFEIIQCVADGQSAKQIALRLEIAPCTVERHIENVRLKTATRNRPQMIAQLYKSGLLSV